jgi:molecular chaperone GrpE
MTESDRESPPQDTKPQDAKSQDAGTDAGAAEQQAWEALESEIGELKDRLLRAVAETENVRKRAERERNEASQYAAAKFARDMLSVADNLRRALTTLGTTDMSVLPEAVRNLLAGVEMTERELLSVFQRHGIKQFEALDEKFDAHRHEALFEVPGTDKAPGTVVQVIESGYLIGERLLRPARVGIAKGEPRPQADPAPAVVAGAAYRAQSEGDAPTHGEGTKA